MKYKDMNLSPPKLIPATEEKTKSLDYTEAKVLGEIYPRLVLKNKNNKLNYKRRVRLF